MNFDVYDYTNKGGRSYNEDCLYYKAEAGRGLFIVADGLGGHQYGEVASQCVCDTLAAGWKGLKDNNFKDWLEKIITMANTNVVSLQDEKQATLKSTVVALAVDEGDAAWANVGDSRLYYIHNSRIQSYTNDHSVAYKKFKAGEITRDDIRWDEDQSALLRSVGNENGCKVETYVPDNAIEPGDAFLLCSDGVWEYLSDEEILIDLLKSSDSKKWAELLLLRLMNRIDGENDNLSLITVMVQ